MDSPNARTAKKVLKGVALVYFLGPVVALLVALSVGSMIVAVLS